ncbi:DUF6518 family protein, partial [Chloroflexota bacterium]
AIGGLSLGIALKNWAWAGFLTIFGAVGFSIGYVIYRQIIEQQILGAPTYIFIIWGIIGGSFVGAALGYLEKRRADRESQSNLL